MTCRHVDLVDHLSPMLADNAVALHVMANPGCAGVQTFPCGDHFHIGHHDVAGRDACLAANAAALEDRKARRAPRRRP